MLQKKLMGLKNFAGVNKLKILSCGNNLGLSGLNHVIKGVLIRGEQEVRGKRC